MLITLGVITAYSTAKRTCRSMRMKLNINMKNMYKMGIQVKMFESSKLDYTGTSNGYK